MQKKFLIFTNSCAEWDLSFLDGTFSVRLHGNSGRQSDVDDDENGNESREGNDDKCDGWVLHIAKVWSIPSPYWQNVKEKK